MPHQPPSQPDRHGPRRHRTPPSEPQPNAPKRVASEQPALFETEPPPWELPDVPRVTLASVVFSEAPHGPFDYAVPVAMREPAAVGMRMKVPLGRRRQPIVGWCIELKPDQPGSAKYREVAGLVDPEPLCDPNLVRLVLWISHYYQAPPGLVFDTLIPAGVRSAAGTREQSFLSPAPPALDDARVAALSPKQQAAVRQLIAAGKPMMPTELAAAVGCTEVPIRSLIKNGFLAIERRRVMSEPTVSPPPQLAALRSETGPSVEAPGAALAAIAAAAGAEVISRLSAAQDRALGRIVDAIDSGRSRTLLLHGVTGSGKTEVYIRAIERVVRFGRGAIVLVPEISLTPQTRARFENRFRGVAVLHSQMSPTERHRQWQLIRAGKIDVVVGPRSAVFAPVPRLGLIVIDEEHDGSFKQDTQPRYHARRVAHRRAGLLGIPLVLGSATPSLESYQATRTGHAELVRMDHRIANRPMPAVRLVDLREREQRAGGAMSRPLLQAVRQTLSEDGQVILLLNRRGFATQIQCPACGKVVSCPHCDLPLTHHRDGAKAVCHYCDYGIPTPPACPSCGSGEIRYAGLGTQKLEAEVKGRFPNVEIARMDSDTMRKPGSHQRVLSAFRSGQIKILLGTQMIAKGLDFPNVLLVGVINADSALHFPDFRAAERTFQLVTQVAGRTGRGNRGGQVIVQTFSPDHPAIVAASRHDYESFFAGEMVQRQKFNYPPLGSVARIILRGESESLTEAFAESLRDHLQAAAESIAAEIRILGPAPPPIAKLRGKYRFHILLQSTDNAKLGETIRLAVAKLPPPARDDLQFVVDIDPLDML
ncbi:MAG: primosomal protein N' [Planctomycetaceae bacterium]|nr:MAG: primosomal protein N' [Planctomycetaceae bacterium]